MMSHKARAYIDSVYGARSNATTKKAQAPTLQFDDSGLRLKEVRFDGWDGKFLIDRKLAVVTTEKAKLQAMRQSRALEQNRMCGKWQVPDTIQAQRARKMFSELNIRNIKVEVVDAPKY